MVAGKCVKIYVISKGLGSDQLEYEKVWEGKIPHESDYAGRAEPGAELGRDLLYAMARQDPYPVIGIQVVEVPESELS